MYNVVGDFAPIPARFCPTDEPISDPYPTPSRMRLIPRMRLSREDSAVRTTQMRTVLNFRKLNFRKRRGEQGAEFPVMARKSYIPRQPLVHRARR